MNGKFNMVRGACLRFLIATALVAAEAVAAVTLLAVVSAPSDAQFFWGDRSSSQNRRSHGLFDWFKQQQAAPPHLERPPPPFDYPRPPPPKRVNPKTKGTATTPT